MRFQWLLFKRLTSTTVFPKFSARSLCVFAVQAMDPVTVDHYRSAMVLSGVGDALGYYNGSWEFCHSGPEILEELQEMGGLDKVKVELPDWMVSDDTVMHLATAEALMEASAKDRPILFLTLAKHYKESMNDMHGRAEGLTSSEGCAKLKPNQSDGYIIPFNTRGVGCGAAMRAMCIGLRYQRPEEVDSLIAVSVESGRMTHHHPTGYLGSLASALFTAYAIQRKPVREWGAGLMSLLPRAQQYIKDTGRHVQENLDAWPYFTEKWQAYLEQRGISDGTSDPTFPQEYGPKERDDFYRTLSFSGWAGASGHDAPMIAYDALLASGDSWEELCKRSMFHGGDSDSTGVIAGCCWGAMYGYKGVHENNYKNVEYRSRLEKAAEELYNLSHTT
ncbi:PREDICTED: protein ADP-ribosylarginine hydrolase-like [Branchiostoma belcheri]|uniref:ADP-ribosylhydrolase ARH1 n=1 Tax=Branchiostoma belcheri TaxID=7741 RepID=A0A6P4XS03_BRABE|nr:PREDICTED: protein ADP-ribosylarginine hydrolase-like [Branchiostoma belcheri]